MADVEKHVLNPYGKARENVLAVNKRGKTSKQLASAGKHVTVGKREKFDA